MCELNGVHFILDFFYYFFSEFFTFSFFRIVIPWLAMCVFTVYVLFTDNSKDDISHDTTLDTLELPESITITYNGEEVTLDVIWDTSTFIANQIGEQVIYGVLSDDELYDQYNIKRGNIYITLDVLPLEDNL